MTTTGSLDHVGDEQLAARLARLQQRRRPSLAAGEVPGRPGPARRTRRHPAAGSRAGALLLTLASTAGLGALFADLDSGRAAAQALTALPAPIPTATAGSITGRDPAGIAVPSRFQQAFDGDRVVTRYGPVQVQAQFSNGSITEVAVISSPDGDGKSRAINARALPQLRTEALAAQQAKVDTVSGATYTSDAYGRSLQAAIDEAQAAGAASAA